MSDVIPKTSGVMERERLEARLKWFFTIMFVSIVLAHIVTSYWSVLWVDGSGEPRVLARDGRVSVDIGCRLRVIPDTSRLASGWDVQRTTSLKHTYVGLWFRLGRSALAATVPLWPFWAVSGFLGACFWYSDWRTVKPYNCRDCGYDLTGNVSGRCPECGASCMPDKRRGSGDRRAL